jgi:hypothetical protein
VPKPPSLTFLGAAGEVTGSCTLLETEHARILVDFGLFQGSPAQEWRNADAPPIDFRRLSAVVCTHAHVDHCGRLGMLPGLGYDGLVFCTEPTAELLPMVLRSSANLQKVRLEEHRDGTGPDAVVIDPPPDPALADAQRRTEDPPVLYGKGDAERVSRPGSACGSTTRATSSAARPSSSRWCTARPGCGSCSPATSGPRASRTFGRAASRRPRTWW